MARLLTLALFALFLALPSGAQAHSRHSHRSLAAVKAQRASARRAASALVAKSPVVVALAIAERYWNAVPCAGQVTVLAERGLPSDLDASTDGWVTFDSSLGANDLDAPAATYTQCKITLARWQWPTAKAMKGDWNMFCLTVIHELGHLLGHPHSTVPGSVMAPVFSDESSVPSICRSSRG